MDKETLHQFIDDCWESWAQRQGEAEISFEKPTAETEEGQIEEPKAAQAPDTRAVRTKATGDKVYLLNDKEMTKRWVTSPEVLKGLGFDLADVVEIPDLDLAKYKPVSAAFSA